MKQNTNVENEELSLSKQRKIQRKLDIEKAKRNRKIGAIVGWVVLALLAVALCFGIFLGIRRMVTAVTPNGNYSSGLTAEGLIENVKATDYVTLGKYKGIEIAYSSIKLSDEDLQKQIDSILSEHAAQSTTTDKAIEKGDVVVVDYKSFYEDGSEVANGATGDSGSTITVGSSSLKDYGFDDALIGKKITDDAFVVECTFPESYTTNKDVAGKTIKYAVAIKSIKITPEFTDEFVKENFEKYATTADEYRAYLKETTERDTLMDLVCKQVVAESTVKKYPSKYLKQVKSLLKYSTQQTYTYYYNLYNTYYGVSIGTFEKYVGMSMAKFDISLIDAGKEQLKTILVYQAIAEEEGITATLADYRTYYVEKYDDAETFDSSAESRGHNAMVQQYLQIKVADFITDNVVVTGKDE